MNRSSQLVLLIIGCFISNGVISEEITELVIAGATEYVAPNVTETNPEELSYSSSETPGELLRSIPGVSASRIGGHGLEPIIRGQQQTQIAIVNDGAVVHGACPNRMDPPTSLASMGSTDILRVEKGYHSVTRSAGGPGGSIILSKRVPGFSTDRRFRGKLRGGASSNSSAYNSSLDLAFVDKKSYARNVFFQHHAGNYQDGGGKLVRSAFSQMDNDFEFGWTPNRKDYLVFGFEYGLVDDALFPGSGMDSPETQTFIGRLKGNKHFKNQALHELSFNAYTSMVDHVMDNFSLRERSSMFAVADSDSNTNGVELESYWLVNETPLTFGVDFSSNTRDARKMMSMMSRTNINGLQSVLYPDVSIRKSSFFSETDLPIAEDQVLRAGVRYDNVYVSGDAVNQSTTLGAMRSPNQLYQATYGYGFESITEHNWGGLLRYENKLSTNYKFFSGLSRVVRTADTTERSLASDSGADSWIGNPDILPEQHHQIDIGVTFSQKESFLTISGFYDWVEDFILRDLARGQAGILRNDGATIYRNVDATLTGFETELSYWFNRQINLISSLSYTYGQNEDTDIALAQIPPLSGQTEIVYKHPAWSTGVRARYASKQHRVDTDPTLGSGRDPRVTPGYGIFDAFFTLPIKSSLKLQIGVSNIFDKLYANHLNRATAFEVDEIQVNEPGRTFFASFYATF